MSALERHCSLSPHHLWRLTTEYSVLAWQYWYVCYTGPNPARRPSPPPATTICATSTSHRPQGTEPPNPASLDWKTGLTPGLSCQDMCRAANVTPWRSLVTLGTYQQGTSSYKTWCQRQPRVHSHMYICHASMITMLNPLPPSSKRPKATDNNPNATLETSLIGT